MKPALRKRAQRLLAALLAAAGLYSGSQGAWIHAKAALAQWLLADAWQQTLGTGRPVPPWPWADTWPVARLRVPAQGIDQIVLAGDSGRTLAFGPGHTTTSALPGESGTTVISGHRDTHFRFLRELEVGDRLLLETPTGDYRYRVDHHQVVDHRQAAIADHGERLVLVTCYPFDALLPGGPLRYVVEATPVETSPTEAARAAHKITTRCWRDCVSIQ